MPPESEIMTGYSAGERLNLLLAEAGLAPLDGDIARQFADYLSLYVRWNEKLNLSAIDDERGILSRHFIESIAVARNLPKEIATLLDFGSGAGLPGIPIALCRHEISVTLVESQTKKAAFLQEVVRILGLRTRIVAARAETLVAVFDCVTLRAVDRMPEAVSAAVKMLTPCGWLALMTTDRTLMQIELAAGEQIEWREPVRLPKSDSKVLGLGRRVS